MGQLPYDREFTHFILQLLLNVLFSSHLPVPSKLVEGEGYTVNVCLNLTPTVGGAAHACVATRSPSPTRKSHDMNVIRHGYDRTVLRTHLPELLRRICIASPIRLDNDTSDNPRIIT